MTAAWFAVVAWLALIIGHAIGKTRRGVVWMPDEPRRDGDMLMWQLFSATWLVAGELEDRRPKTWGLWLRPFDVVGGLDGVREWRPGAVWRDATVVSFRRELDLGSAEIMAGDPRGEVERAAREIAARLRAVEVVGFVHQPFPSGLDWRGMTVEVETNVCMRMGRAYNITDNRFITVLECLAAVKC